MSTSTKAQPVEKIRIGPVVAAIWRNETEKGPRFNVTLERIYKTDQGWQSTASLGRDDLLVAGKVLDRAHSWIHSFQSEHETDEQAAA